MNQAELTRRFDALQDEQLNLYETGADDLPSQIRQWELTKQLNMYMYYGRQEGYTNFGMQRLPTLQVSEYNAKIAINMLILLKSLAKSKFKDEKWTLGDTSSDLMLTPPRNTFKKSGYQVRVEFDNDPENFFLYTNWDEIYYQDLSDKWHKTQGKVDHNGLFFDDISGDRNYFQLFAPESEKYGKTGLWTVHYKSTTISSVVTSSSKLSSGGYSGQPSGNSRSSSRCSSPQEGTSRRCEETRQERSSYDSPTSTVGSGRGKRKRESESKSPSRRAAGKRRVSSELSPVSAEEVGSRHRSLPRHGLSRLRRLEAEARDPDVLLVKGSANNLKCWRYRCEKKFGHLFSFISSVFRWINDDFSQHYNSRLLVAFENRDQRNQFLMSVTFPKQSSYVFGSLDSL